MPKTQLILTGTPGKRWSFLAKREYIPGTRDVITQLGLSGTPSRRWVFESREEVEAGPHTGQFTQLCVMATAGRIHLYSAKGGGTPPPTVVKWREVEAVLTIQLD